MFCFWLNRFPHEWVACPPVGVRKVSTQWDLFSHVGWKFYLCILHRCTLFFISALLKSGSPGKGVRYADVWSTFFTGSLEKDAVLPTLLFFPYYLEQKISEHLSEFAMSDFRVNVENRCSSIFEEGLRSRCLLAWLPSLFVLFWLCWVFWDQQL